MSSIIVTAIGWIGAIASLLAAAFWIWASLTTVPDNIDTFIGVLQKTGRLNAIAAFCAAIAAFCALLIFWNGVG